MAKGRKKKRNKLKTFLSLAAIFIACFLVYTANSDLMMTTKLEGEIASSEEMINSLEDQKDDPPREKQNLENPEYARRFARDKYIASKSREQVFKLSAKDNNDDDQVPTDNYRVPWCGGRAIRNWRAITFDIDGMPSDAGTISMKAWRRVGETLQLPTSDEFILSLIERARKNRRIVFDFHIPRNWPQEEACSSHTQLKKEEELKSGVPLMGDVKGLPDTVKAKGYTIVVATNASAEGMEFNLNSVDIQHYFEAIISDEMITHREPTPGVYLKAAQQLNLSPQGCLIMEDSLNGVRAASGVSTIMVMIPDRVQPTKETKVMCNYILKSLGDLKEIV